MVRKKTWIFIVIIAMFSYVHAGEKAPVKVFISVDMEGIWGVVHYNQTSSGSSGYGEARKWMVQDVNAVVEGLLEAGATEIVVNDSHGSMRNIIADDLHPKASLISGKPKPLVMMAGIDSSFDACVFVGYHAKAGTASAILDHTISGGSVRAITINKIEMPELGLNGAIAGYFNVPVIMISGDEKTCKQAKSILGNKIVTVAVKEGMGRYAAKLLPAAEARRLLKENAKKALLMRHHITPFKLEPPFNVELEFQNSSHAEMPLLVPQVKRIGQRAVGFSSNDFLEAFNLLRALISLGR
jgi:D-amino peptidase